MPKWVELLNESISVHALIQKATRAFFALQARPPVFSAYALQTAQQPSCRSAVLVWSHCLCNGCSYIVVYAVAGGAQPVWQSRALAACIARARSLRGPHTHVTASLNETTAVSFTRGRRGGRRQLSGGHSGAGRSIKR